MVNWHNYNESLVRRGEIILDFDVIDSWDNELDNMNDGKEGACYRYPNSFVQLLGYMRAYFHLPYRQTEGVVRVYTGSKVRSIPDYSTINRRVNKLDIRINKRIGNDIVIVLDSTGIKVTNRGEWLPHKWNIRKGYLKIHVAVDVKKKKIVSLEVTTEEVYDGMMLRKLIENAAAENNNVKRVIADGAYDSKENFRYLFDNDIEAAIKVRKNSSADKITDSHPRKIVVQQQLKNFEKWKDSVSYGYRWIAETVFSSIKRMFGEYVSARKYSNMVKEMMLKASLYNIFITRK
ncbi:MAG TPA: IS5 family transposase [Nitrososphaeraceae archaeon]|nr:IS5 family transposase [Nitrososphaeraceae archaeon]